MIKTTQLTASLFSCLDDLLNRHHPLYQLSHKINWSVFENAFTPLYCLDNGRPAKPIRLMCGLLILKHLRNISDESVVEHMHEFVPFFPAIHPNRFIFANG
jgi:IS5 family transposase